MKILRIYTDGACSGNQNVNNVGGWGAILEYGEASKELFGGQINTTNNRMEMTALLEAFKSLNRNNQVVEVFSDSSYLMDCFRKKWYIKWHENGWKTAKKTDVENKDLWQALFSEIEKHDVRFYRVKGHVNPDQPKSKLLPIYEKFIEWNGSNFTFEDFEYITRMNIRADMLANQGISQCLTK